MAGGSTNDREDKEIGDIVIKSEEVASSYMMWLAKSLPERIPVAEGVKFVFEDDEQQEEEATDEHV